LGTEWARGATSGLDVETEVPTAGWGDGDFEAGSLDRVERFSGRGGAGESSGTEWERGATSGLDVETEVPTAGWGDGDFEGGSLDRGAFVDGPAWDETAFAGMLVDWRVLGGGLCWGRVSFGAGAELATGPVDRAALSVAGTGRDPGAFGASMDWGAIDPRPGWGWVPSDTASETGGCAVFGFGWVAD